ncbi:sugar ABC transporter substrate-binding protein [Microbacterium sp. TNHR37B]|uniref:sugar ABC transporter substrate-binding protein n=1 Tax=Microbacterium sp. TNHR37B TaxID=1775956 RepID=UPI0007B1EF27|nr:extracellular solute-binding protein [Microbacterium sp. TNHR37B]KZE88520.1 Cyclodextrin-binding protein [Microbacterium sp. TNHR37B]
MKKTRRVVALGALGMVGVLALAGCGRADDAPTGSDAPSAQALDDGPATGEITIWAMGEEGENLGDFSESFTKANPDAKITVTTIPWADVMTKYQTAVAAGTVPDAIMIGSSLLPSMVAAGGLAPVPDGVVDESTLNPTAAESTQVDGASYAVPWYVETRVLYYRSDLAEKAGLSAPTSWEELTDFAKGFTDAGAAHGIQLPMGDAEDSTQVILPFYAQAGGEVLNSAGDAYAWDHDALVSALEYYASFFTDGLAPLSGYGDSQTAAFTDGSNPAFISGPWMVSVLADMKDADWVAQNVATVPVPAGAANNDSYLGGGHLGVFADAKNADGAWKFIKWLSQADTQKAWFDLTSDLPAVTSVLDAEPYTSDARISVLNDQLENTVAPPSVPSWDEMSAFIETEAEKVANGSSADAAASAIEAKAESLGTGW